MSPGYVVPPDVSDSDGYCEPGIQNFLLFSIPLATPPSLSLPVTRGRDVMSAEVRQSSFYLHSLINSVTLSLSSLSVSRLWPEFCLFINLIFVSHISFPTFCPCLICVFPPTHLLPDTCPASLPLIWFVLWWSVPFLNIEQGACFHRCRFDKAQFVHIKDRGPSIWPASQKPETLLFSLLK